MDHGPTTHPSLIMRLRDPRDETAWGEFVEIYEPLVLALVKGKGFQHADAIELTQDVLVVVVRAVGRWDPDPQRGSFRGWLATITRRLMINFLASPARRFTGSGRTSVLQRLLQEADSEPIESGQFDAQLQRRLFEWAALRVRKRVEPATWEAFWQTAVQGRTVEAVATELGMTAGFIYIARSRVMRHLRLEVERQLLREGER